MPDSSSNFLTQFIQFNVAKRDSAQSTLFKDMNRNSILLIQEPVVNKANRITGIPSSHTPITPASSKQRNRASIILPSDLFKRSANIGAFCNPDSTAITCKLNNSSIAICSLYMDGNLPIPASYLIDLAAHCSKNHLPVFIGTDSNAHHTLWGHPDCNARGIKLVETLAAANLYVVNIGNRPTFIGPQGKSIIDLTIVNDKALGLISDWKVQNHAEHFSDHERITFSANLGNHYKSTYRNIANCDWECFKSELKRQRESYNTNSLFRPSMTTQQHDHLQSKINDFITRAFDKACPVIISNRKTTTPWWNPELSEQRANCKRLRNIKNHHPNPKSTKDYKDGKALFQKILRKAKIKSWREFCSEISSAKESARISKILQKKPFNSLSCLRKADGSFTSSPIETLQLLGETLLKNDGQPPSISIECPNPDKVLISAVIHPTILQKAVNDLPTSKTPGPDSIRNEHIIQGWDHISDLVHHSFYHSLLMGRTPSCWNTQDGVIIPKPDKPDYCNPKAFRIISLSSAFQKLLEKLIYWHIESTSNLSELLTEKQFGFKRGTSTDAAIHKITRKIEDAILDGGHALGLFLDIEGAFDNISFDALTSALKESDISPTLTRWIVYLIQHRTIILSHAGEQIIRIATKGCPQGGVLSPFLWNLALAKLLNDPSFDLSNLTGFADDLASVVQSHCLQVVSRDIVQHQLNTINEWCQESGLKLNAIKTKVVLFTRKRNLSLQSPLILGDTVIECSSEVIYLGATLDSKLTWAPLIEYKCLKATKLLFACKSAISTTWGLSPPVCRFIYQNVILPYVSHGCIVWFHTANSSPRISNSLSSLQRLASLIISNGYKSTPTAHLEILSGLIPIDLYLSKKATLSAMNLISAAQFIWPQSSYRGPATGFRSHAHHIANILKDLDFQPSTYDHMPTTLSINNAFNCSIPPREAYPDLLNSLPIATSLQVYTDGSRQSNLSGAGFVTFLEGNPIDQEYFPLGRDPTVFQAEMFAIEAASMHLLASDTHNQDIFFFSDSSSSIKALCSLTCSSRLVSATISALNHLCSSNNRVTISWVPSHTNIKGNEAADSLAKQGSSIEPIGPLPFIRLPRSHYAKQIDARILSTHLSRFRALPYSQKGIIPISNLLQAHPYSLPSSNRDDIRLLTTILSGHSALNYFTSKLDPTVDSHCQHCPDCLETSEHFLALCPAYSFTRFTHFSYFYTSIDFITKVCHPSKIIAYIRATGRFAE